MFYEGMTYFVCSTLFVFGLLAGLFGLFGIVGLVGQNFNFDITAFGIPPFRMLISGFGTWIVCWTFGCIVGLLNEINSTLEEFRGQGK